MSNFWLSKLINLFGESSGKFSAFSNSLSKILLVSNKKEPVLEDKSSDCVPFPAPGGPNKITTCFIV